MPVDDWLVFVNKTNLWKWSQSVRMFYLFLQITNQLVLACKDYVKEATISDDNNDYLWNIVLEEIKKDNPGMQTDPQQKQFQAQLVDRLKVTLSSFKAELF